MLLRTSDALEAMSKAHGGMAFYGLKEATRNALFDAKYNKLGHYCCSDALRGHELGDRALFLS